MKSEAAVSDPGFKEEDPNSLKPEREKALPNVRTLTETPLETKTKKKDTPGTDFRFLDLFLILIRYRILIVCSVLIGAFISFFACLGMKNYYKSEAVIVPRTSSRSLSPFAALGSFGSMVAGQMGLGGHGDLQKMEMILDSKGFAAELIRQRNLMPILFPVKKPDEKKNFSFRSLLPEKKNKKKPRPPTIQDGVKALSGKLRLFSDRKKNMIRMSIEHENPGTARNLVYWHIIGLSERLRGEDIREADENIRFFRNQIDETEDPLLREKLYNMLAGEIEKKTLASAQKYYGFMVLDPPVASDLDKRVRPNRRKAVLTGTWLFFFFGLFLAAAIEFSRRMKKNDSPGIKAIFRELSFTGKRDREN